MRLCSEVTLGVTRDKVNASRSFHFDWADQPMAAVKELRGVAHDLAHHSQSGLSWLHPHLAQACRSVAAHETTFDLLVPDPYPSGLPELEPLRLAINGLRIWFLALLDRLGHPSAGLTSVRLTFQFRLSDDHNSAVEATIATAGGKEYAARVDYI